jgi:hypothetical protein
MAWTVQKLIDGDMAIHAYCQNSRCGHHRRVDLEKIKAKLGPDAPAMADDIGPELVRRFYSSRILHAFMTSSASISIAEIRSDGNKSTALAIALSSNTMSP